MPLRSIGGTNRNTADGGRGQHQGRERQKPPDAPGVELAERDGPRARDLVDEQTRDEEAGEHEEHVDADESPADDTDPGVERHDEEHCDGAQALDVATEPLTALPPRLGRGNIRGRLGGGRHRRASIPRKTAADPIEKSTPELPEPSACTARAVDVTTLTRERARHGGGRRRILVRSPTRL